MPKSKERGHLLIGIDWFGQPVIFPKRSGVGYGLERWVFGLRRECQTEPYNLSYKRVDRKVIPVKNAKLYLSVSYNVSIGTYRSVTGVVRKKWHFASNIFLGEKIADCLRLGWKEPYGGSSWICGDACCILRKPRVVFAMEIALCLQNYQYSASHSPFVPVCRGHTGDHPAFLCLPATYMSRKLHILKTLLLRSHHLWWLKSFVLGLY